MSFVPLLNNFPVLMTSPIPRFTAPPTPATCHINKSFTIQSKTHSFSQLIYFFRCKFILATLDHDWSIYLALEMNRVAIHHVQKLGKHRNKFFADGRLWYWADRDKYACLTFQQPGGVKMCQACINLQSGLWSGHLKMHEFFFMFHCLLPHS